MLSNFDRKLRNSCQPHCIGALFGVALRREEDEAGPNVRDYLSSGEIITLARFKPEEALA